MTFDPNDPAILEEQIQRKVAELRVKTEEDNAKKLADKSGFPYLNLFFTPVDPEAINVVEESRAREAGLAVVQKYDKKLKIAVKDPLNSLVKTITDDLTSKGYLPDLVVVSQRSLEKSYSFYQKASAKAGVSGATNVSTAKFKLYEEKIKKMVDVSPLLKEAELQGTAEVLELILGAALSLGTSDVHVESEEKDGKLRYRLDGMLYDVGFLDLKVTKSLMLRLKLISGLKINVVEEPQDGRFSIKLGDLTVEIRTSILPGPNGENAVLRVLHPKAISVTLDQLGFQEWDYKIMMEEIEKPDGMIMVTGPTGSGKTTTLYSIMRRLNTSDVKIITLEDPVEYHVAGLEQVQIDSERGLTFASGLRSILRQDPDVILVGELRDHETVETALHAALTGHLVLTTMHTNDSAGTIPRLIDVRANPSIIAPAVNLAVAQRLVRKVCSFCGTKTKVTPEELIIIKKELEKLSSRVDMTKIPKIDESLMVSRPKGCDKCNDTGYKGRLGLYELFPIDNEVKEFILKSPSHTQLEEMAAKKGTVTMRQDGFLKVAQGVTDIAEIHRMLGKSYY
jgi:type IV pilus assembly protein PilB